MLLWHKRYEFIYSVVVTAVNADTLLAERAIPMLIVSRYGAVVPMRVKEINDLISLLEHSINSNFIAFYAGCGKNYGDPFLFTKLGSSLKYEFLCNRHFVFLSRLNDESIQNCLLFYSALIRAEKEPKCIECWTVYRMVE